MDNSDKLILHLCADIGSDSQPYRDKGYKVVCVGKDIGVENYAPPPGSLRDYCKPTLHDVFYLPDQRKDAARYEARDGMREALLENNMGVSIQNGRKARSS